MHIPTNVADNVKQRVQITAKMEFHKILASTLLLIRKSQPLDLILKCQQPFTQQFSKHQNFIF
jgi:hypothetical protein